MFRRSGIRFADKDMRKSQNLRRFPFIWDHRVIPYERKTLYGATAVVHPVLEVMV
jgi:hypothetical protein